MVTDVGFFSLCFFFGDICFVLMWWFQIILTLFVNKMERPLAISIIVNV